MLREVGTLLFAGLAGCGAGPHPVTVDLGGPPSPVAVAERPQAAGSAAPSRAAKITWLTSDREAVERARKAGRPLLVWARADWDAAGLAMDRSVWTDPRVIAAAQPFVALRLDLTDVDGDGQLLADHHGIRGVPTVVLADATGQRSAVLTGTTDVEALVAALKKAAE